MRYITISILSLLSICLFVSCKKDALTPEGPQQIKQVNVSGFTSIINYIPANIEVNKGTGSSIELQAPQNILEHVRFSVNNNKLNIDFDRQVSINNASDITLKIMTPELNGLENYAIGSITTAGNFNSTAFHLKIFGNSSATLTGTCNQLYIDMQGESEVNALAMAAQDADVKLTGNGTIKTETANNLSISITGNGTVYYKGNPQVSSSITGNGKVIKL